MNSLFTWPAKVLLAGLILAMIATFTWRSVEIPAVYEASINAAHSAVANPANYQAAAKGAVNATLPGAQLQTVQQVAPDVTAATVSYQPVDAFPKVFSYLGVPDPNQPIVMTGTAPGGLADLALTVPNLALGAGQSFIVSGSLKDGQGDPIPNKTITMSDSGGSLAQTVFTTNSQGGFSTQYTASDAIGPVSITASGDGADTSITVNIVDNVTFNSFPATYTGQTVTISGTVSPVDVPQQITLVSTVGSFANGGTTTTNSSGSWSIPFAAPSFSGPVTIQATSGGGQAQANLTVLGPTITFSPSIYSTGTEGDVTVSGTAMLGSSAYTGTIVISGSGIGGTYPSSVTPNSSGNFSFTYTPPTDVNGNPVPGSEQFNASAAGTGSTNSANIGVYTPTISISPQSQTINVNSSQTYTATVTGNGSGLSDQLVTVSTNGGGSFTSTSGYTNSSGQVTFTLNVGSAAGTYTITASSDGSSAQTNFTVASPAYMTLSATSMSLQGFSVVSGQLTQNGVGVSGVSIKLEASTGNFSGYNSITVTTGYNGDFGVGYQASSSTTATVVAVGDGTYASTPVVDNNSFGNYYLGTLYGASFAYDPYNKMMYAVSWQNGVLFQIDATPFGWSITPLDLSIEAQDAENVSMNGSKVVFYYAVSHGGDYQLTYDPSTGVSSIVSALLPAQIDEASMFDPNAGTTISVVGDYKQGYYLAY